MIRFLNLKNQICEGQNDFAFYDTVAEKVLMFENCQVFMSKEDFESSYLFQNNRYDKLERLKRFTSLIPENYFNNP